MDYIKNLYSGFSESDDYFYLKIITVVIFFIIVDIIIIKKYKLYKIYDKPLNRIIKTIRRKPENIFKKEPQNLRINKESDFYNNKPEIQYIKKLPTKRVSDFLR